jgi:hypothetical protein
MGWVIGVHVEVRGEPGSVRHFYAIGHADRAKAEWTAVDWAQKVGDVATSPVRGDEPVQMLGALTLATMGKLGLQRGEVRELGIKWPRRWLAGD